MKICVASPDLYTYGAMVIGGIIRDAGYDVTITRNLATISGDIVFLSLYSTQHLMNPDIREAVIRVQKNGGRCIIGGPVAADPEMVLGELHPDLVISGEGDEAVIPIIEDRDSDEWINCVYLSDETLIRTHVQRPEGISRPLPLIPDDIGTQNIRGAQTYIETHRGCFGRCGFCQVPVTFGKKIRSRSPEEIFTEVKAFKAKGVKRIALIGGTGTLYRARDEIINEDAFISLLKGLAEIMGTKNISCPDIRADAISDPILEAIRDYTIGWIFFGIESGSEKVLSIMKKGIPPSVVEEAANRCRKHGVRVAGSFIVGYPGEENEDFEATKEIIERIAPDDVFISVAEPIPATSLAELVLQTPDEENPVFFPHTGEYKSLNLTEAEARALDLMQHADMCRPIPRFTSDVMFREYLQEVRKQGTEIRTATNLLRKYHQ